MLVSSSPEHIVGNYVLHRLCVPRYPPLALCSLTFLVGSHLLVSFHLNFSFSFFYAVFKVLAGFYPAFFLVLYD